MEAIMNERLTVPIGGNADAKAFNDTICIYPDCPCTRRTRGLCHGHYQTMRSYVRRGLADEADLIARGLLLPEGTGGTKISVGHDAFLKGSTVKGRFAP